MRLIISLTILVVFACAFLPVAAQTQSRPVSTKFDEYGAINSEDLSARLDNFAVQLQNEPASTGYIFVYAPEEPAKRTLEVAKEYLINTRGFAAERIVTIYGGRNDVLSEPRVQLWLRPPGAPRPKTARFKSNLDTFRGLFSEKRGYDFDSDEPLTEEESKTLRFPVPEIEEYSGPVVTNVTHAALAEVLKQQKTAVTYIVGYNGEESTPGAWRRLAHRDFERMKDLGVEASRLRIIYGGTKEAATVQLWVASADAPPPVSDVGPEQPPSKAVSLDWIPDNQLGYSGAERQAFKRIVAALRQFPTLRACVVVTISTYQEPAEEGPQETVEEEETPETDATEVEPEPEPADLPKLVEKWKEELAKKHNIGAERFVVLFTHSNLFSNNLLETWLVPLGAELPKPEGEQPAQDPPNPTPAVVSTSSIKGESERRPLAGKSF